MKKLLSILLALVLVLGLLAGCASSADQGAEEATEEPAAEAEAEGGEEAEAEAPAGGIQIAAEDLRVALILPGTIDDQGWNTTAYLGLQEIEKTFGCETHYSEFVEQSEFEARFRSYAEDGFNVIIGHGSEFFDAAAAVAPDFPEAAFIVTSTNQFQEPNLASVNTLPVDMGVLAGVAMASATKTGVVGSVGGMSVVSCVDAVNAATAAALMTNPDLTVFATMTGDFEDTAKAKEVTQAMIDKGADVIFYDADAAGLGSLEACQENGILAIPAIAMNDTPNTLMGAINDVPHAMDVVVSYIVDGTFTGQYYPMGCADDCAYYIPGSAWDANMDEAAAAAVEDAYQKLISGEWDAYQIIEDYCPDELRVK